VGDIIIEETNHRAFALTLAGFFMLVASVSIFVFGLVSGNKKYIVIGLLASLIFFLIFLILIVYTLKEKNLLTITVDGIIDSPSIGGLGFISYDDILDFEIIKHHDAETIAVILKNRESFILKMPPAKRRKLKTDLYLKQPLIMIHAKRAKDMDAMDILTLLQKRLRDHKRLYE